MLVIKRLIIKYNEKMKKIDLLLWKTFNEIQAQYF